MNIALREVKAMKKKKAKNIKINLALTEKRGRFNSACFIPSCSISVSKYGFSVSGLRLLLISDD